MNRTESDAMSGLSLDRNIPEWSEYTEVELERHFSRFKEYDLDNTGFVTEANLKTILEAMEIPCTDEQVKNMITEAGYLTGHENDGRLSFRDFMKVMDYEAKRAAHNERVDSVSELAEAGVEPPPDFEATRLRGSSLAVMDTLATSRIEAFQQVIKDAKKKEKEIPATPAAARFQNKLAKFKRFEDGAPERPNNDNLHKQAIKGKLAAFEAAQKSTEDPVAFKKEWKNTSKGKWEEKQTRAPGAGGGAPPPKKNIADLP